MNAISDMNRLAARPLAYVVACQPLHGRLRDVAIQLGGLSLIAMLPRRDGFDGEAPLRAAADALAGIRAEVLDLAVPPPAAHHHRHMAAALAALARVAALLGRGPGSGGEDVRREISAALRAGTDHIRHAANAMPGFETVDLRHSCCAAHAAAVLSAEPAELRF